MAKHIWQFVAAMVLSCSCFAQTSAGQSTPLTGSLATRFAAPPFSGRQHKAVPLPQVTKEDLDQLKQTIVEQNVQQQKRFDAMQQQNQRLAQQLQQTEDKLSSAEQEIKGFKSVQDPQIVKLQNAVAEVRSTLAVTSSFVKEEKAHLPARDHPSSLHYKGVNITPGGYVTGDTVYRTRATGGDTPTAWSSLPYEGADAYKLSEFHGGGRASRLTVLIEGQTKWGTLRGYAEGDFLGVGAGSNNNQSNSYDFRQRVLYAEAKTNTGWTFAGGQLWSLATEGKKGISSAPVDNAGPLVIDSNNTAGFIWARQYGFRVVKSMNKVAFGISVENPQLVYTASMAGNTPYAVLGSSGNASGSYNSAISSCTPSTSIVNYTNEADKDANGITVNVAVPVYKTVNSCSNVTNISFNKAPDTLVKLAFDPGFGHYEVFGIAGIAHETIYPGETTDSNLYGGLTDSKTGQVVAPALTTAGAIANSIVTGGLGASFRIPVIRNLLSFGAKGLVGPGVGRYGQATLADVTANAWGGLSPIHNVSGMLSVEATPNLRLTLYLYYGGDYAGREDYANAGTTSLGAPSAAQSTKGIWGGTWKAPTKAAVGYGSRQLNNSTCNSISAPGYNGSSTGYYAGASCGAQTRNVQEVTGGYWFDIYKGDRGRLRQGMQYGYGVREGWSGAPLSIGGAGIGAKGIDNMVWTTFRYYLP
jgi:hypothetical protein